MLDYKKIETLAMISLLGNCCDICSNHHKGCNENQKAHELQVEDCIFFEEPQDKT
jgi:hypothetical protein